jgi:hypothetical protein
MDYKLLTDEDKHKDLAAFLHAQERDHFLHTVNRDRYAAMLAKLPHGPFRQRIEKLHQETCDRLAEVEAIILGSSFPPVEALRKALVALRAETARPRA